jgi:putative PIN family toxin of toxin-antitoxin system
MLHAVFDTNVLVSALIRHGKPRKLWNEVLDGKVRLEISDELLSEFNEVIARSEFNRYVDNRKIVRFRRVLLRKAKIFQVEVRFPQITEDPDDNMAVEAAHATGAKYVVSGDRHLLKLKRFRGIKIVTVDEMLRILTHES